MLIRSTVDPPAANVNLDLSGLAQKLQPGRAYTLQIQVTGLLPGGLAIAGAATASANNTGVALQTGAAGSMNETALAVSRSLSGNATITKTLATAVVHRVHVALVGGDGAELSGSVTLTGQGMADDAWLGVVPGETEP